MSRRAEIQMSDHEVATFMDEQRTLTAQRSAHAAGRTWLRSGTSCDGRIWLDVRQVAEGARPRP